MGKLAAQVKQDRANRNAARATFDARLAQVRQDLDARSIGGRIANKLELEARGALEEAVEIASDSKGVAVGTAAALALWYLRNPILGWLQGLFAAGDEEEALSAEEENVAPSSGNIDLAETEDEELGHVTNY